jgi:hypothetical protein
VLVADVNTPDAHKLKKALAVCCDSYLLCMILQGSDNSRFYQLKTDLANNMTKGQDNFPKTIVKKKHFLNDYKVLARQQCVKNPNNDGVAFVQNTGGTATVERKDTISPTAPNSKCKKSTSEFRTSTLATVRKDMACSCQRKTRAWPSCKMKRRKREECKASSRSTTCTLSHAPAMQTPHTVNTWGMWKCKNVTLWDKAMQGCVE